MNVTFMPIVYFMSPPFALNAYSFRSSLLTGLQKEHLVSKKGHISLKNVLLKHNFQGERHLYANW